MNIESRDRSSKKWLDLLHDAARADSTYQSKCDSIDKLYSDLKRLAEGSSDREFQIFWANLEVLKNTVYSRPPVPVVSSRFKDRRELPRRASEILERALVSDFESDNLHETLLLVRDDMCVNARGVPWVRLGSRDDNIVPICEHIDRKDFRHGPARKWQEVPWVARRSFLDRAKMRDRFGDEALGVEYREQEVAGEKTSEKKAAVWEIWHRDENVVVWVAENGKNESVLDMQEPWLDLTGFFPCPKPAYATLQRSSLTPVPDFVYYRDQVEEINELTARISALSEALRMRGFYPSGSEDVGAAIEAAMKRTDDRAILVPISSLAALGGGNVKDSIVWLPVKEVAEVIAQLVSLRRQLIDDVYQITGISDIMRGETEASETLGAQQLKSQYGNIRVRGKQEEMQRIARDITRLKAEIMAEEVPFQQLLEMAQVDDLPTRMDLQQQAHQMALQAEQQGPEALQEIQPQLESLAQTVTQEQVQDLFQSQRVRPFVLDIETDSTIQPDENAEKERRAEFLTAVGGFLSQATPLVMQAPILGEFVAESLLYAANGFRVGRSMSMAIDDLAEKIREMPDQPSDPMAEAEAQRVQAETDRENALAQAEIRLKDAQAQKIVAEINQPDQEPVSVDPMDAARMQLEARKVDQADRKMNMDEAKTYAEFVARENEQDRQENNDG